jgi:hypothetical protein
LLCPVIGRATDAISNTGQPITGNIEIDPGRWEAQSFITSSSFLSLDSVTLYLMAEEDASVPIEASLYSNASGHPGSDLVDFNASTPIPTSAGNYLALYSAPGGSFTLSADTDYWIVASAASALPETFYQFWNYADSNDVDNPGTLPNVDATSGWSLAAGSSWNYSTNQGGAWAAGPSGDSHQFSAQVTPLPEPGAWAMVAMGAALLIGFAKAGTRGAPERRYF